MNEPKLRFKGFNDEWKNVHLTNITKILNGLTYSPKDIRNAGTFVIRSSNIQNGRIVNADNVYVNSNVVNSDNVKKNDVIVVVRNGSKNLIGKHANVNNIMNDTVIGAFMSILRSDNGLFLNCLLSTDKFKKEVHRSLGSTINQITKKDFSIMKFEVPSSNEQQKIGSFFEKLDQLIQLQSNKLEHLELTKKGYLTKIFPIQKNINPQLRFKNFIDKWTKSKLNNSFEVKTGKSVYNKNRKNIDNKYPILGSNNIIGYDENYDYDGDFVLIARVGKAGNLYKYSGKSKITDNTIYIETKNVLFLMGILKNNNLNRLSFGTTRKLIKSSDIKNLKIKCPSFKEQEEIEKFLYIINQQITLQQQKLDNLKLQKKAYLQKMFI